jgi:hypothetical protein
LGIQEADVKELCLEHAVEGLDRFPTFGETVPSPVRIKRSPRDLRIVTAFLIWAVGVASIGFLVSFAHEGVASKAQADSWLCKRK